MLFSWEGLLNADKRQQIAKTTISIAYLEPIQWNEQQQEHNWNLINKSMSHRDMIILVQWDRPSRDT